MTFKKLLWSPQKTTNIFKGVDEGSIHYIKPYRNPVYL